MYYYYLYTIFYIIFTFSEVIPKTHHQGFLGGFLLAQPKSSPLIYVPKFNI